MSSDLTPRTTSAPPLPPDGDNRYKALQAKLKKFARALEDAGVDLDSVRRSMKNNADHTDKVATDIAHSDFDEKYVMATERVATALGSAAKEVGLLAEDARETADLSHEARRTHRKRYGPLDEVRSGRKEKTPKPGVFAR
jgi:DNA-binding transcriptional MerR regulator